MKHTNRSRRVAVSPWALLLALCLLLLPACDVATSDTEGTTDGTVTTAAPDTTEAAETTETTAPETTLPETTDEPETPSEDEPTVDPSVLDFDTVESLSKYFTHPTYTEIEVLTDPDEGQVISFTTEDIGDLKGDVDPYTFFKLAAMAEDAGYERSTSTHPYLVLKVKNVSLWNSKFMVVGYEQYPPRGTHDDSTAPFSYLADTDGWQYVAFDLTSYGEDLAALRLDYEASSIADGEQILISEIKLCKTAEEAGYRNPIADTYPLPSVEEMGTLHTMSFNVHNNESTQFPLRADMLHALIDEYRPDSIGVQEDTVKWRAMMEHQVFNQSYARIGDDLEGAACSIFYRADMYDVISSATFWLSETPDVPNTPLPNANEPRFCTYVHLKNKFTGQEYIHVNTHLDHKGGNTTAVGVAVRLEQIQILMRELYKRLPIETVPLVLTGDFNQSARDYDDGSVFPLYLLLTGEMPLTLDDGTEVIFPTGDAGIDAAVVTYPEGHTGTMVSHTNKQPIDYQFYSKALLDPLTFEVQIYNWDGVDMSDHLPLYATYSFK